MLGILASGVAGGLAGWALFAGLDLPRVLAAVLAAATGMVVATAVWLGLTLIVRRFLS
jgi:hypothetical protein